MKLCECGCGNPAPIADRTNKTMGYVKGQPMRFCNGHYSKSRFGSGNPKWKGGKRISTSGYIHIFNPNHPRSDLNGYVAEQILVAEKILGKNLPDHAVVHHINGIKTDNSPSNLVICENNAYHVAIHNRMRFRK